LNGAKPIVTSTVTVNRLRRQQGLVLLLLFLGYGAYYFCRANLSVATPLIVDELAARGMDRGAALIRISGITSLGVLAYALGKLTLTQFADLWGGRKAFLAGLGGAAVFTVLFVLGGGLPIFTIAWIGNRLTQSVGWAGLIKVCSRWFNFSSHGTIVGILSLSYLVGDAGARQSMGYMIEHGSGWRAVFVFAAGVAALLFVLNALFLRESRAQAGHAAAAENPLNVFAGAPSDAPRSIRFLLKPLLTNIPFLLVCALSFGCTVIRESFNAWTPTYLDQSAGYSAGRAASLSALFPAVGAVSVLAMGWLSDLLGVNGRALILACGLAATTVALGLLGNVQSGPAGAMAALLLIGITAFCLLGPYSYLGGAMALDFGGKHAGASASGLIDGVGYLGGTLAGIGVARISVVFGWRGVFVALAVLCGVSTVAAAWLCVHQVRLTRLNRPSV
jgi:OPA family glycerol-3-phosphate transporter-like MFS transporter